MRSLLRYNAHQAFPYAISFFQPTESPRLKAAFARALRAFVVAVADVVGPSQCGLRNDAPSDVRNEAKMALDYLFQVRFAMLLSRTAPQASARLLGPYRDISLHLILSYTASGWADCENRSISWTYTSPSSRTLRSK